MHNQFNKIVSAFGSNRVAVRNLSSSMISFDIGGWSSFMICYGQVRELIDGSAEVTPRAEWLQAVSLGKKRNEDGVVA
jgi:hypothetical protein